MIQTSPLLACASFASLLLIACTPSPQAQTGGGKPSPEVEIVTVHPADAPLVRELPGRLLAYRSAQVRARVEGIVEQRLFHEGSEVRAGVPLFRIDARSYRTALASARADLEAARATAERYRPLLALHAVSQQEFDAAVAAQKQAEAAVTRAEIDLENASVPAPIAGRIGRTLVTEGALVGRGDATHLATIEQIDPIYVDFTQPGRDWLQLRRALDQGRLKSVGGGQVELILEDGSRYEHAGRLLLSELAVDAETGALSLRALFPNPRRELLPGMYVRIRNTVAAAADALTVPQKAVLSDGGGQYVLIVDAESKAARRSVRVSGMSGQDWIIAEGLVSGDRVIVSGLQKARPGQAVSVVAPGGQAKGG